MAGIQGMIRREDDVLVPDPVFAEELGIHLRTLARWDEDQTVGVPKPVKLRNRKYRWRSAINEFKARRFAAK
jgi:hypothetical protein